MLAWTVTAVAVLVALMAWLRAGRLARKLDALTQSYWELRYDFTRLRSQVARLDADAAPAAAETPPAQGGNVTFVPLASMKKKG
jgi:hypothetical protein